jgi:enoyl-CoA hydratase
MDEPLLFEIEDGVATITINRERRRNAIDDATLIALRDALDAAKHERLGAIVMRGAGTQAFSAGSDIKALAALNRDEKIAHTERGQDIADAIERHPVPVIAAIEGYCLGGGLEMAMACDYRIAGDGATLGLPEVRRLGGLPSWGATVRLPRIVGVARAREMILFGRALSADEALEWGLVNRATAAGEAYAEALVMAKEFAAEVDPGAAAMAKQLLTFGYDAPTQAGRHMAYLADITQLASDALDSGLDGFAKKDK